MKEEQSVVEVQHQIRANASQLQDYFTDLYEWEKSIGKDDAARKKASKTAKGSTQQAAALPPILTSAVGVDKKETQSGKKPDAHTYDKGYKRWEKFDVDAALREADDGAPQNDNQEKRAGDWATPRRVVAKSTKSAADASKSREELEKEEGNAHYKRGDYVAAIKSYTRCLGYNPQNAVVLSNRAMAYLKNREFANAEDDCTLALKADPSHVKSYSRRGTARNSLGKHRLALLDFHRAATLDPKSRQIQTQLQSTRDLMRTAIKRSPKRTSFSMEVVGEDLPVIDASKNGGDASQNKENHGPQDEEDTSDKTYSKRPLQEASSQQSSTIAPTTAPAAAKIQPTLPKLPKKAPATSYEFCRVWKTLALRDDSEQKSRLTGLRAEYLRMIQPTSLVAIFKTGMESDVLCEIFHVFRSILKSPLEAENPEATISFVLGFASELSKVPRFSMTIMLLSESEKRDVQWVASCLQQQGADSGAIANLKKLYELP